MAKKTLIVCGKSRMQELKEAFKRGDVVISESEDLKTELRTIEDMRKLAEEAKHQESILNNPKAAASEWIAAKGWLTTNAPQLATDVIILCNRTDELEEARGAE